MYGMARTWAPDAQLLRLRAVAISEVKSEGGKSGAWETTFVSPAGGRARMYTYSVVEAEGNLHEGVFAGQQESYLSPRGQDKPFPPGVLKVDSDKAYETAMKQGADYAKKNPNMPVTFQLEYTARHTNPVWRVLWGQSIASSGFSVLVDGATGQYLGILR